MPTYRRTSVSNNNSYKRQSVTTNNASQKRLVVVIAVVIAFFLFLGIDSLIYMNKFYSGVTISGVDVSGKTKEEAASTLQETFDSQLSSKSLYLFTNSEDFDSINIENYLSEQDRIAEQISATEAESGRKIYITSAGEIGAKYDYTDAVNTAIEKGKSANVFERIALKLFGDNTELKLELGEGLDELYTKIASNTGEAHVDWNIEVVDGVAKTTEGHDGTAINRDKFSSTIASTLQYGTQTAEKLLFEPEYDPILIDETKASELAEKVNDDIKNGVTFEFRGSSINCERSAVGDWITTEISGDNFADAYISPKIDTKSATEGISRLIVDNTEATAAEVKIAKDDSGEIKIHPTGDVVVPKLDEAISTLENELFQTKSENKNISVQESDKKDNFTVQEALYAGIIREISSYTTTYTSSASTANRNHNIHLVSDYITNSIISSDGGVFSFDDAAGPCTENEGFLQASAISEDEVVQEVAGGICQVATTVFNCAYLAGLPIVERHPHSLRMLSYPAGRDAAVSVPELDLKFENDSTSDMLLVATYDETSVTITLFGKMGERYVETDTGDYKEAEKYKTKFEENQSLAKGEWNIKTVGTNGTSITIQRKVYLEDGSLVYNDVFDSTYSSITQVIQYGPGTDTSQINTNNSTQ